MWISKPEKQNVSTTPPVFVPEVLSSFALINPFPQVTSFSEHFTESQTSWTKEINVTWISEVDQVECGCDWQVHVGDDCTEAVICHTA